METDTEYLAYETIVKNDKRQRIATFLLLMVVLVAVLASVLGVATGQKDLVATAQKDGRIRTEENRRYITCLLILEIEKRNEAGQRYCFEQSDLPGGRESSEFNPVIVNADDVGAAAAPALAQDQPLGSGVASLSLPNSAPSATEPQSNTSQAPALQPATGSEQSAPSAAQELQPTSPSLGEQLQGVLQGVPILGGLFKR